MHTTNEAAARREQSPTVLIHAPDEGERIWFLDTLFTVKASARTGARFGLAEQRLPRGSETPFHRHHEDDESFYVLDGTMTLFLEGGRVLQATPGTFAHIPAGVAHGFRATSPLRMLVLSDPAGFVEFVRDCGVTAPRPELPPAAHPDLERVVSMARKHRIDLLGPLPGSA